MKRCDRSELRPITQIFELHHKSMIVKRPFDNLRVEFDFEIFDAGYAAI